MRCLLCEKLSFYHICRNCQFRLLQPGLFSRKILSNIPVYSFYKYHDIEALLLSKHTHLGYYIYKILAENSFKPFAQNFKFDNRLASIAVDDHIRYGYSHTAILNQALKSKSIIPYFDRLKAKNTLSYSGKSYQERLLSPRHFRVKNFREDQVILVDDIITTGLTLTQAVQALQKNNKEVLFCLCLTEATK